VDVVLNFDYYLARVGPSSDEHSAQTDTDKVGLDDRSVNLVKSVDHPAVTLCFDVFHIGSLLLSHPDTPPSSRPSPSALSESLDALSHFKEPELFSLVQLTSARAWVPELHKAGDPEYQTWSCNLRNFPLEEGGILPVIDITRAIVNAGYKGWYSMETFERVAWDERESIPDELARRGIESWKKVVQALNL
jgi:4-hydroxyphenylpyruvate dioxygenase